MEGLEELVKKHLPEMAAKEMKEFIEQANKNKTLLISTQEVLNGVKLERDAYEKEASVLRSTKQQVESKELANTLKEAQLDTVERNQKITALTVELAAQKQSKTDIFALVSLLVKNPRAIEMINSTEFVNNSNESVYDNRTGNYKEYVAEQSRTVTGTKEIKEDKDE